MRADVERLRRRTKEFAVRVIRLYESLPTDRVSRAIGHQAFRSATSVGAQYREACRSRSNAELTSKLEAALQEVDETDYWLEILVDAGKVTAERLAQLRAETNELTGIFVTTIKNLKSKRH